MRALVILSSIDKHTSGARLTYLTDLRVPARTDQDQFEEEGGHEKILYCLSTEMSTVTRTRFSHTTPRRQSLKRAGRIEVLQVARCGGSWPPISAVNSCTNSSLLCVWETVLSAFHSCESGYVRQLPRPSGLYIHTPASLVMVSIIFHTCGSPSPVVPLTTSELEPSPKVIIIHHHLR